jgi:two-component system, LytTR family, response regulator
MSQFRVLVVDDEPLAREIAVNLLRGDCEIDAVVECGDGESARDHIARDRPDIVFLDIEMPGVDGLKLADAIQGAGPVVVFMTAFSRYALDAFDVAATDYVLKPFSDARFHEALSRAKRRVRERRLGVLAGEMAAVAAELQPEDVHAPAEASRFLQRVTIKQGSRSIVIRAEEVTWIEAEDYCVMVHSARGHHLIRASLAWLEERLDPARFVRAHRTAIVNVEHVREMDDRNGLCLTLSDGTQVAVSRARKRQVEEAVGPRLR